MIDKEESDRARAHRSEQISGLARVEGFKLLREEAERKRDRMTEEILRRIMAGESLEALRKPIEEARGFIAGMNYVLNVLPGIAVKRLRNDQLEEESEPEDIWSYGH